MTISLKGGCDAEHVEEIGFGAGAGPVKGGDEGEGGGEVGCHEGVGGADGGEVGLEVGEVGEEGVEDCCCFFGGEGEEGVSGGLVGRWDGE